MTIEPFALTLPYPDQIHVSRGSCFAVGVTLQYFLLATWAWMVASGVNLYNRFVRVFHHGHAACSQREFVLAWGVPAVVTALTAGLAPDDYADGWSSIGPLGWCWVTLSWESPPTYVILVLCVACFTVNTAVLLAVLVSIRKHSADQSAFLLVKAAITFSATLGIQYVFAAVLLINGSTAAAYLFTITTAFQGSLIAYFHAFKRPDMRKAISGSFSSKNNRLLGGTSRSSQQVSTVGPNTDSSAVDGTRTG